MRLAGSATLTRTQVHSVQCVAQGLPGSPQGICGMREAPCAPQPCPSLAPASAAVSSHHRKVPPVTEGCRFTTRRGAHPIPRTETREPPGPSVSTSTRMFTRWKHLEDPGSGVCADKQQVPPAPGAEEEVDLTGWVGWGEG